MLTDWFRTKQRFLFYRLAVSMTSSSERNKTNRELIEGVVEQKCTRNNPLTRIAGNLRAPAAHLFEKIQRTVISSEQRAKKKKKKFRVPRCWLEPQLTALSPFLFLRHPVFIGNPPSSSKERTRERSKWLVRRKYILERGESKRVTGN